MKGYLELIKAGCVECGSPEYWNFISVIEKCVGHVEALTTDLLDAYKLESTAMRLTLTDIPFDTFIEECKAEIHPILAFKRQKLVIHSSYDGQGIVADRLKLNQVVMNLLSNASKYSPRDSLIEIHVDRNGDHLLFGVKDQGVGLNPGDIPQAI